MEDITNQMGLFDGTTIKTKQPKTPKVIKTAVTKLPAKIVRKSHEKVSGLVPDGDVRLTANIRQDLHLKLKIAAAHQRSTIGELLEGLIEKYI